MTDYQYRLANGLPVLDPDAVETAIRKSGRAQISWVKRHFKCGYNLAACMVEEMEARGVVTRPDKKGQREILPKVQQREGE